ncbi:UNVERIFIED_CONTAM: Secreted RxLR effector protein [Sesamum indicum]
MGRACACMLAEGQRKRVPCSENSEGSARCRLGDTKAWLSTQFFMKDLGNIQYVVQCNRPNVAYALSVTSKYQIYAEEAHWIAIKTILKYLRRTKDMFLVYGGGKLILEGYSDTCFKSNDDDVKSRLGFVFKLNDGVVTWKSFKQDTIADSTTEAEYIAVSEVAKEAVWMKNYIQKLGAVPNIAEQ